MEFLVSPALISNLNVHKDLPMLNVKYWRIFCVMSLFAQFLLFYLIGYPKVSKVSKFSMAQFLRYNGSLLYQRILAVTLNFDLSMSLFLWRQ